MAIGIAGLAFFINTTYDMFFQPAEGHTLGGCLSGIKVSNHSRMCHTLDIYAKGLFPTIGPTLQNLHYSCYTKGMPLCRPCYNTHWYDLAGACAKIS